jgi:Protein of unknown function (DUF3108)
VRYHLIAGLALAAHAVAAQTDGVAISRVPFKAGERFSYDVKFGSLRVGHATLALTGSDTAHGQSVMHVLFAVQGSALLYHVNDTTESWFDPSTMTSYRFWQDINEGGHHVHRRFEFYPESQTMQQEGKASEPSVPNPLDDATFLYFVRTQPLVLGKTYQYDRYFRPRINPVVLKVLRKEKVTVPAGTFDAIVVQPIFKTAGIFSEGGHAEVWVSDDSTRAVLQIKSKLTFGSLNLYLRTMGYGPETAADTAATKDDSSPPRP